RFRAVVISHARALVGMPSRGHRSAAMANASCAASSARSKSPRKPIRVARTRPHSSRKTCSSVLTPWLPIHLRGTDLDGATIAGGRDAGGHLDGRVEVVRLEDEQAADGLLHPDERAVRGQGLAAF